MAGSPKRHREAAARHESAAATHDRAARFWEEAGDTARADLHQDSAAHEREGAALERRWAELIEREGRGGGVAQRLERGATTGGGRDAPPSREIDIEVSE